MRPQYQSQGGMEQMRRAVIEHRCRTTRTIHGSDEVVATLEGSRIQAASSQRFHLGR